MQYFVGVIGALVLGALAGGLVGFPIQHLTGQNGWVLVVASIGANTGALWAAMRRADDRPAWRVRGSGAPKRPAGQATGGA